MHKFRVFGLKMFCFCFASNSTRCLNMGGERGENQIVKWEKHVLSKDLVNSALRAFVNEQFYESFTITLWYKNLLIFFLFLKEDSKNISQNNVFN